MIQDFKLARLACVGIHCIRYHMCVLTLRGFNACTTLGRRYCCASKKVTEAVASSSVPFRNLLRPLLTRHDANTRVTLRKYRAYDRTRRDTTQATAAIFNLGRRMPRDSWRQSVSYYRQCRRKKFLRPGGRTIRETSRNFLKIFIKFIIKYLARYFQPIYL